VATRTAAGSLAHAAVLPRSPTRKLLLTESSPRIQLLVGYNPVDVAVTSWDGAHRVDYAFQVKPVGPLP
jgi:hypothetical protein